MCDIIFKTDLMCDIKYQSCFDQKNIMSHVWHHFQNRPHVWKVCFDKKNHLMCDIKCQICDMRCFKKYIRFGRLVLTKNIPSHMCDIIFKTDPMFGRFALTKNKHFKCDMSHVSYVLTKNIPSHMCDIIFKTDPMFGWFALTKNKHFKCDMSHVSYVLTKNIPSHMCDIIIKTDLIFARFVLTKKISHGRCFKKVLRLGR